MRTTFLHIALPATILLFAQQSMAQERFATRNGQITFFSETPVENIEAQNGKVSSVFDVTTGAIEFAVLIKAFQFEKALMQEHFNENYMESATHPKATFKGRVTGLPEGALERAGEHEVTVEGDLTIKGVSKPVSAKGTMRVEKPGTVLAESVFIVRPEDHDITIPKVVRANIAEQIEVRVRMEYTKM